MDRKTKKINLFSFDLLLSERTAGDFLILAEYSTGKETTYQDMLLQASVIVQDALKINYENLKWYNYFKKKKLRKLLSSKYLLNNLSQTQIFQLAEQVLELDGLKKPEGSSDSEKKT